LEGRDCKTVSLFYNFTNFFYVIVGYTGESCINPQSAKERQKRRGAEEGEKHKAKLDTHIRNGH